jgi:PAS domain S-box-containing protein
MRQHGLPSSETGLPDGDERLHALMEAMEDCCTLMLNCEGCIAEWKPGIERILGWTEADISGKHVSMLLCEPGASDQPPRATLHTAVARGSFRRKTPVLRKDGGHLQAAMTIKTFYDQVRAVRGFLVLICNPDDATHAEHGKVENQSKLRTIVNSAMDAIITVDADYRVVLFNNASETMFRCVATESLGQNLNRYIPERFRESHDAHIRAFATIGVTARTMERLGTLTGLKSNGEEFPIEASISKVEVRGSPLFTVIVRDITQRKRWEERRSLLLPELSHRVKNSLSIVQSLVAQTRKFAAPDTFYVALSGQLAALGAAHDLLTISDWAGATLSEVIRFAFAPYEGPDAVERWNIEGVGIWLASNDAVTLSLVFHELSTNAAKYGALSNDRGSVTVHWNVEPDVEPTTLKVHWIERDGPTVVPPIHRGFGSRLLEQALGHELGGHSELLFTESGAECRLSFPLSQKVSVQQ